MTIKGAAILAVAAGVAWGGCLGAEGVETKVMVRAVSRDAKIIGGGVGGAAITIRDAVSGEVLAEGKQLGGTGDTRKIIVEPRRRHESVYDTEGAAGFLAVLHLEKPTLVEISAQGPLDYPQALGKATTTMWLAPGDDVLGDGVLLEIHGFIVDLLSPADEPLRKGTEVEVRATVRMT